MAMPEGNRNSGLQNFQNDQRAAHLEMFVASVMGLLCWLLAAAALRTCQFLTFFVSVRSGFTKMGDFDAECHFKPKERQRLKGEKSFSVSHVDHEQQAMIEKAGVCSEQGLGFFLERRVGRKGREKH